MNARDIQNWLHAHKSATFAVLLPNYTPDDWHECDMFGVTRAGYFHEFEIKLTRADFRADAKKRSHATYDPNDQWKRTPGRLKHERLAIADTDGPSRFWYVVPTGLVAIGDVPAWAGLIYVLADKRDDRYAYLEVQKEAPKLHAAKVDRTVLRHAMNVCYYRFWGERHRLASMLRGVETMKKKLKVTRKEIIDWSAVE